jgi:8-oxo-dGTP pyrophosphatase MutT (NUDIX family)
MKPKSEFEPKEDDIKYQNDHVTIVEYEGWSIVDTPDMVVCIIYLIEQNRFILRHEYIPTFKYCEGQDYHMTVLSGTMEKGEDPKQTLLREIQEEAGIVVSPEIEIEFMKPLFLSKGNTAKYHPAIITLTEADYHEVTTDGDGTDAEDRSKTAKLELRYLGAINTSDLITDYLIEKFKLFVNFK